MSSEQPEQPPDNPAAPFHRPFATYANHINDLIRGPLFLQNGVNRSSPPAMSSNDPARSDASAGEYHAPPRVLPTLAEADERRRRLIASMVKMYPIDQMPLPETGTPSSTEASGHQGFSRELEEIVIAKREQTSRYEAFHVEWTDLQGQLQKKAEDLRAKYSDLIEQVHSIHHKYIRDRIKKDDYTSARKTLADQMDHLFEQLGNLAFTMGTMYAESRAVAQGANPTGDFNYGNLDIAACNAVPFLMHHFPEFVKKKPSSAPPDPFGPRPAEIAFKNDLPSFDFHDMMATVWRKHPTKLQDIHSAVCNNGFAGVKELTQKDKDNANALLGSGGEWSI